MPQGSIAVAAAKVKDKGELLQRSHVASRFMGEGAGEFVETVHICSSIDQ
jgi:hypothetical protein